MEGALQGVTLSLSAAGSSQTLTISQDTDTIYDAISAFVSAYNSYVSSVDTLTAYDADTDTAGELLGDSTTRRISTELSSYPYTAIGSGTFSYLSQLGISLKVDGTLEIDEDTLTSAITDNIDAVSQFFIGTDGKSGFHRPDHRRPRHLPGRRQRFDRRQNRQPGLQTGTIRKSATPKSRR